MHSPIAVMVDGIVHRLSGKPAVRGVRSDRHIDQMQGNGKVAGAIIMPM
jgi:hypothetical protein